MLQRPQWRCKFNQSGELGTLKASRHQSEAYSPTGGVTRDDNLMNAHFTGLNSSHIGKTEINLVLWLHLRTFTNALSLNAQWNRKEKLKYLGATNTLPRHIMIPQAAAAPPSVLLFFSPNECCTLLEQVSRRKRAG